MTVRRRVELLIERCGQLVTMAGGPSPRGGTAMRDIGLIEGGAVAVGGDRVVAAGPADRVRAEVAVDDDTLIVDASGRLVMPGLVDCHTHLVYAGSREDELALKLKGTPYLEILAGGGGILSTVRATRAASLEELVRVGKRRLDTMLAHGTTMAEVKSGYGLTTDDEVKCLEAVRRLDASHPVDLVPTFLGAHAIPPEYRGRADDYVALVVEEMIPAVAARGLAEYCDVFCEEGVFSVAQSRRILEAGKAYGLQPRVHADEMVPFGGTELAAEIGAASADHLLHASDAGLQLLRQRGVVPVVLPGTSFCLMLGHHAAARKMIDMGLPVALATDFNPGTCPTESLLFIMTLACYLLGMTPEEIATAVTINAACALGRGAEVGSIEAGKKADIVVMDVPSVNYLLYRPGVNPVVQVIKAGRLVVDDGRVLAASRWT